MLLPEDRFSYMILFRSYFATVPASENSDGVRELLHLTRGKRAHPPLLRKFIVFIGARGTAAPRLKSDKGAVVLCGPASGKKQTP